MEYEIIQHNKSSDHSPLNRSLYELICINQTLTKDTLKYLSSDDRRSSLVVRYPTTAYVLEKTSKSRGSMNNPNRRCLL